MKKTHYCKQNFTWEEDEIVNAECEECGCIEEDETVCEDGICCECGGNLMINTIHESCQCDFCGCLIDMWDGAYRGNESDDTLICKDCYEELPDSRLETETDKLTRMYVSN